MSDLNEKLWKDLEEYSRRVNRHVDNVVWEIEEADDYIDIEDIERYYVDLPDKKRSDENIVQYADRILKRIDIFNVNDYEKMLKQFRAFRDKDTLNDTMDDITNILTETYMTLSSDVKDIKTMALEDLKRQHETLTSSQKKPKAPKQGKKEVYHEQY